ncbi:MAG: esterase, partial [Lachnospiraceae bacterium]|nr:esterase [Lachnospiraceae bacterium]
YGNPDADTVLIQPVDNHDLEGIVNEAERIKQLSGKDFCLVAIKVDNWNSDLSPWEAPAVFGNESFGGKAAAALDEVLKLTGNPSKTYYIGGYSLAGLFAIWAAYQTDVFKGVAAASPSVWFPGFSDYMAERKICANSVYLSLGDKEEKTRNPVMATVGDNIRKAHELLKAQGVNTVLEWNPGNHFKDPDIRMAKGFEWVIKQ